MRLHYSTGAFCLAAAMALALGSPGCSRVKSDPLAGERPVEWVALEVAAPSVQPAAGTLFPPPGKYKMRKGDSVVLQARDTAVPPRLPVWTGDARAEGALAPLVMDGPKHVTMEFDGARVPGSGEVVVFDAPEMAGLQTFLGSGGMYGWFQVNRRDAHMGAGIITLVSADAPFCPVFNRPNLNFEHIVNGSARDAWRAQDTPRHDPMRIRVLSPSCVEVRWPAESSAWKLDCLMRYTFSGRNAVDMEFEVTPRADEAPRGYLLFMWASYLHMARERSIHFPGLRDGVEGWVSFGKTGESGTVAGKGQAGLDGDPNADGLGLRNIRAVDGVRFTEPVFYGIVDGDQNIETAEDAAAFIMMFDDPDATRFAVWNWGDGPYASAWDWQYVLNGPEVGKTRRHRARLVLKPFAGEEDVLAEYRAWREALRGAVGAAALPLEDFPVILSPGDDKQDPVALGDALCASNPAGALAMYRQALRIQLSRFMAANQIDALFNKSGDSAGLSEFWKSMTEKSPMDALAWEHLGRAHAAAGDREGARAAWEKVLQTDPENRGVRESLRRLDDAVKGES